MVGDENWEHRSQMEEPDKNDMMTFHPPTVNGKFLSISSRDVFQGVLRMRRVTSHS